MIWNGLETANFKDWTRKLKNISFFFHYHSQFESIYSFSWSYISNLSDLTKKGDIVATAVAADGVAARAKTKIHNQTHLVVAQSIPKDHSPSREIFHTQKKKNIFKAKLIQFPHWFFAVFHPLPCTKRLKQVSNFYAPLNISFEEIFHRQFKNENNMQEWKPYYSS